MKRKYHHHHEHWLGGSMTRPKIIGSSSPQSFHSCVLSPADFSLQLSFSGFLSAPLSFPQFLFSGFLSVNLSFLRSHSSNLSGAACIFKPKIFALAEVFDIDIPNPDQYNIFYIDIVNIFKNFSPPKFVLSRVTISKFTF